VISRPPVVRRGGGLAVVVAVVAVLVAVLAVGVAGWAVHRANVAVAATEKLVAGPQPTGEVTPAPTEPAPTDPSTDSPATEPTSEGPATLDPEAAFKPSYEDVGMNVQVTSGGSRTIDLDQPSVDSDPDITLQGHQQATTISLNSGVTGAMAETTDVPPKECLNRIKLSALAPNGEFPLRKGQVYCIQTSQADAQTKGETQKIVVVSVAGISDDGVVSLKATAYFVPG
jgi:hypothetical protein